MKRNDVLIVAHRGSSGSAPENTLAAFRQAIADGADGIELDVRLTKDGELIVLHDQRVNRTTNGRGKVWQLSCSAMQHLDAGSWYAKTFSGERIPTLREVLTLLHDVRNLPKNFLLNVEVKTDGQTRSRVRLGEALARLLREERSVARSLVSSFDHRFLKRVHELAPEVRIGALYLPVRDFRKKPSRLCSALGATAFVCSKAQLNKRLASDVLEAGLVLACYGVNRRQDVQKVLSLGASVVITDYPKEIRGQMSEVKNDF
jgi:glycerophosphoryl diester phosphodiesterase